MKKTCGDYVMEIIQALVVGGGLSAFSYFMWKKMMKDIWNN